MSKKIKEVYDADPTAGDDLTKEGLFAGDDGANTPVAYTRTQVSDHVSGVGAVNSRLAALETGTTPVPDTAFWNATILDNTLTANVFVSDYTGEAWIIVKDSDVTPTDDSVGATPPTGFTPGNPPNTYDMALWQPGDLYFYQWDQTNGIVEKLSQSGASGIIVTPRDTLARPAITDFTVTVDPAAPTTQAILNFTPTDDPTPGSGNGRIDLIDVDNNTVFQTDVSDQYGLVNLLPGGVYRFILRAYDLASPVPNASDSSDIEDPFVLTMDEATAGTLNFVVTTQTSLGVAVANETNESTLASSVTVTRTGSTSGSVTVDITLGSRTAIAGTNFVQLAGGAKTLTLGDGVASAALPIVLIDTSSEYDQMFDAYMDEGSVTGGAEIGSVSSALVSVLGSGGAGNVFDMDFDSSGGVLGYNESSVWNAEDYLSSHVGTGTYDGVEFQTTTKTGSVGTNVMHIASSGSVSTFDSTAAHLKYEVEFGTGGGSITYPATFYISMRAQGKDGWNRSVWVTIDDAIATSYLLQVTNHSVAEWEWADDTDTDDNMVPIVIQSAGTHVINIWHHSSTCFIDRFLITSDSSYDPTTVGTPDAGDDGGPIEVAGPLSTSSGTTGAETSPNPDNPTAPLDAPVSGTITALNTVPTSGQTNQPVNINPAAYFNSSSVTPLTATLTFNGGADVVAGQSSTKVSIDEESLISAAVFIPDQPLNNGITYEATLTGLAVDMADNVLKNYTEQWSFTTINTVGNDPDLVLSQDFNSADPNVQLSRAWFETNMLVDSSVKNVIYLSQENPSWTHDSAWITPDPLGDPSRGNVLAVWNSANAIGMTDGDSPPSGIQMAVGFAHPDAGTWDELYLSFDYLRPKINPITGAPYDLMKVQKGPSIHIGPSLATGTAGSGLASMRLSQASNEGYPGQVPLGDYLVFHGYRYDVNNNQAVTFPDDSSPPIGDPAYSDNYYYSLGEWETNEIYIKVNTSGVANGEYRHWVKRKGDSSGILIGSRSNILWTGPDPAVPGSSIPYYKIYGSWWSTNYGGSTYAFATTDNHVMYYDNFILSKVRITG